MNLPALAVATLALRVVGSSGGDDPADLIVTAPLREDPCGSMVSAAPAVGVHALRFDLASTAAAEPWQ